MNKLPPALRERVLKAAAARPSQTRRAFVIRRWGVLWATVLITSAYAIYRGLPIIDASRPVLHAGLISIATGIVAMVSGVVAVAPVRSPLWRPKLRFHLALWVPILLTLASLVANMAAPITWRAPTLRVMAYLPCFLIGSSLGGVVLSILVALERRADPVAPKATGASLGAFAGAWAALILSLQCPHADPGHVLATHILPVGGMVLIGMAVAPRWLAVHWEPKDDNASG